MYSIKVTSVTPLADMRLLVTFENGVVKIFDVKPLIADYPEYAALENPDLFNLVQEEPGGYGVAWNAELDASEGELWENGVVVEGLHAADLLNFVKHNIINTADAAEILDCSRQNIDALVKRQKITPVKSFAKNKLFLASDVINRR